MVNGRIGERIERHRSAGPAQGGFPAIDRPGRYVDDLALPAWPTPCFARSPHAHARIVSIDTAAAPGSARRARRVDRRPITAPKGWGRSRTMPA